MRKAPSGRGGESLALPRHALPVQIMQENERMCAELEVDVALARWRMSGGALAKAWGDNTICIETGHTIPQKQRYQGYQNPLPRPKGVG